MSLVYRNPVWPGPFADPFVLRTAEGDYYAYGTGTALDRGPDARGEPRAFTVLRSRDLVNWEHLGGALTVEPAARDHAFWAPEVAAREGRHLLYYSSAPPGDDAQHRLRVAVSDSPAGPFRDEGAVLPADEGFSIDAHPFRDPRDGRWYLFFAKDFFGERTGTGLAVVPLSADLRRAAAPSTPVLQANADWQIYERDRHHYGRAWTAWHTCEGPCVVVHDGRYWCFYSGGNWQSENYGVSYAVADHPLGPWHHAPESAPLVLRQRYTDALGPGHNSVVLAPDGRTQLFVYHAWSQLRDARRLHLDPLVWTDDGPRCLGPTTTPQAVG